MLEANINQLEQDQLVQADINYENDAVSLEVEYSVASLQNYRSSGLWEERREGEQKINISFIFIILSSLFS